MLFFIIVSKSTFAYISIFPKISFFPVASEFPDTIFLSFPVIFRQNKMSLFSGPQNIRIYSTSILN